MKMQRRNFLKAACAAGLSVLTPMPISSKTIAEESQKFTPFQGPFFLMINCVGGWDTTRFMDPKGREQGQKGKGPINPDFSDREILEITKANNAFRLRPADYYGDFFDKYGERTTFINGVDSGTNGHRQGQRVTWSGTLTRGYPSIAALIAAEKSKDLQLPMSFLTFGGYDKTGQLVVPTRLENMSAFTKIVAPGVARFDGDQPTLFLDSFAEEELKVANSARLQLARANQNALPKSTKGADALFTARLSEDNIGQIMDVYDPKAFEDFGTTPLGKLRRQAYLSLSAFEAGVAVSANMSFGGWDDHANVIVNTERRFKMLFDLLQEIRLWTEQRGLGDKVHIFVGSDFGRTPFINSNEGKDHWAVGSWMHISANAGGGRGTLGGTDGALRALEVDVKLNTVDAGKGYKITPATLHNDIRRLAGLTDSMSDKIFPLPDKIPTPLFT